MGNQPGLTPTLVILQYEVGDFNETATREHEVRVDREIVATSAAPAAIGPYSQAVVSDKLVFVSGQIALNPATGQMVEGGVVEQTRQVMANLQAVLTAAGSDLDSILRTTIYLADLGDFGTVNEIYGNYFASDPPARSTVQAARLPRDARIEIDVIAVRR